MKGGTRISICTLRRRNADRFSRVAWTMLVCAAVWHSAAQNVAPPSGGADAATPIRLRDIAPPFRAISHTSWLAVLIAALLALLLGMLIRHLLGGRGKMPPTPRQIALAGLRDAQKQLDQLNPHDFSVLVSDILRRYISTHFGLHAMEQTSPEFLASVADSARFLPEEKALLAAFLEKCDLIKFARVDGTRDDSAILLNQAMRFVERGSSQPATETENQNMATAPANASVATGGGQ